VDFLPPVVSGTNRPTVNANNTYACRPVPDPNVSSYEWLTIQITGGNLFDGRGRAGQFHHLPIANLSGYHQHARRFGNTFVSSDPHQSSAAAVTIEPDFVSGHQLGGQFSKSVGLCHDCGDGAGAGIYKWRNELLDIYSQAGTGGQGETVFTLRTLSLSNYASQPTLLRFNYDFNSGSYFPQSVRQWLGVGRCFGDKHFATGQFHY